jgi:hypothetical protein
MTSAIADRDFFCLGSCMTYCDDCKWRARWDVVGEFSVSERTARYPTLERIHEGVCQVTNGKAFVAKEQSA